MGWFGVNPLDGDDGLDARSELFNFVGIELYPDNENGSRLYFF
jgi:hypothetical protein